MLKKAQAATEYLIILAVVIIIALIVIGVMGGIPGLGSSGKSKVSESYWGGQTVGLDAYAVDGTGAFKFTLRNNGRNSVTVTGIRLGTTTAAVTVADAGVLTTSIPSGGTATIQSSTVLGATGRCVTGQSYAYLLNITYTDSASGSTNVITGNNGIIKLEGTCASAV